MVAHFQKLTPQEYLRWEQQECRYEYVNGEVFAMTGSTIPHGTIGVKPGNRTKTAFAWEWLPRF